MSPSTTTAIDRLSAACYICNEAAAQLLVQSKALTAQQTGAGFASLMAVLTGSVAQYLYLTLRMRDALRLAAPRPSITSDDDAPSAAVIR